LVDGHEHGEPSWRLHRRVAHALELGALALIDSSVAITAMRKTPHEIAISVRLVVDALAHRAQAAPLCSVHRTGSFAADALPKSPASVGLTV
jgi:hypothetical protein